MVEILNKENILKTTISLLAIFLFLTGCGGTFDDFECSNGTNTTIVADNKPNETVVCRN